MHSNGPNDEMSTLRDLYTCCSHVDHAHGPRLDELLTSCGEDLERALTRSPVIPREVAPMLLLLASTGAPRRPLALSRARPAAECEGCGVSRGCCPPCARLRRR